MPKPNSSLSLNLDSREYSQISAFAKTLDLEPYEFIKAVTLLFTDGENIIQDLEAQADKNEVDDRMQLMVDRLKHHQKFIDLLMRSVYSTQLKLEGQIKKIKREAAKELSRDFDRISIISKSSAKELTTIEKPRLL